MTTIIKIKKNKPAFRALIRIAKELEKADHASISIIEQKKDQPPMEIIMPQRSPANVFAYFEQLKDFPTLEQLRTKAWPAI